MLRAQGISDKFEHTRPNGEKYKTVVQSLHHYMSGENILYASVAYRPEDMVESWMNSSGHRANILNEDFEETGVGVYKEGKIIYCVQIFWTQ